MEIEHANANRTLTLGQISIREVEGSILQLSTAVNSCQSTKIAEECTTHSFLEQGAQDFPF